MECRICIWMFNIWQIKITFFLTSATFFSDKFEQFPFIPYLRSLVYIFFEMIGRILECYLVYLLWKKEKQNKKTPKRNKPHSFTEKKTPKNKKQTFECYANLLCIITFPAFLSLLYFTKTITSLHFLLSDWVNYNFSADLTCESCNILF